jgi:hypothetical protein
MNSASKTNAVLLLLVVVALFGIHFMHPRDVRAETNHIFELMIYHTLPGKANALEEIFRGDSKLMAKHGINVVGFWIPNDSAEWQDTFVYVVDFPSRVEAEKRWKELLSDPESRSYVEAAKPILKNINGEYRVDEVYMRPTDFSALK